MAALAVIPVRPVAVEKVLGHVRFHFALFSFRVPLAVAIVVAVQAGR